MGLINGVAYDNTQVEIRLNTSIFIAVTDIAYGEETVPGEVGGTRAQWVRRTRGKYKPTASLQMQPSDVDSLIEELGGDGYAEVEFPIRITYYNDGDPVRTDILHKCRIQKIDTTVGMPVTCKVELHIEKISRDGRFMLTELAD